MKTMNTQSNRQQGAVSLLIVIFSALLMTIVTVSFVTLMTKDQRQASNSDLSQSAYDSAQAGVEDAKRLLVLNQACQNGSSSSSTNCSNVAAALSPAPGADQTACNTLNVLRDGSAADTETLLQQQLGDNKLDQAYTCVKITVNTPDYLGQLKKDESLVVPLRGAASFNTVELNWFSDKDLSSSASKAINFPSSNILDVSLPPAGRWASDNPALMRTQLIQVGPSFKLSDFNDNGASGSNAHTLFLYPSRGRDIFQANLQSFYTDARLTPSGGPRSVLCRPSLDSGGYACTATITLPVPIGGGVDHRTAFLNLTALYNQAHFQIKLKNDGSDVKFSNVQPEVDSTGRANDLFRRVVSRVELRGDFTYPNAAIDTSGDLCKNFFVTDKPTQYLGNTSCTP